MPEGKSLFLPLAAFVRFAPEDLDSARALAKSLKLNKPGLTDEACLHVAAAWLAEHVQALTCVLDGQPVSNLEHYRADAAGANVPVSDVLTTFGVESGSKELLVSEGYWLMLAPPRPGRHTIQISGLMQFHQDQGDPIDLQSRWRISYELVVAPQQK